MTKAKTQNKKGFFKNLNHKKIVKIMWLFFGGGIIFTTLTFVLIVNGVIGYMPHIEDLESPIDKYASQVYSSDGELIGTYSQAKNNRIYSNFNDLSPYLIEALIATEDARFYSHSGIDAYALSRAFVKRGILQQSSAGGGSTVTQQLAKLLYSPSAGNIAERLLQKPIEWVIAVQLERYYTKDEIINLYLNQFDFLNNAVGVKSASHVYFNKTPKELSIEEAATLVGMCKNPSMFNPASTNPKKKAATQGRRNVVLDQMCKYNYVTPQQADSLKKTPLVLDYKKADHKDGIAPYMREYLRVIMNANKPDRAKYAAWQIDMYMSDSIQWESNPLYGWCNKNRKTDGSKYNLATDGLRIYTTIDARMQVYAEKSVEEHMSKELQPDFDKEKKGRSYAPFSSSVAKKVDSLLYSAMKVSDRYRELHKNGKSDKEILNIFKTPVDMKVFSWKGDIDTVMTPWDSIRYHKKFLRTGFMAMDPQTGYVKAYVGGIDFKYFQYDMVNIGRRQVGSTIKPFLYSLLMQEGMSPCDDFLYTQQVLITETGKEWRPRGASSKKLGETVSIRWGLQNSDNMVTAYLMSCTTPYAFARMLRSYGLNGRITPVISMCLGTDDVSVGEMTSAYTAFANKGFRAAPIYVTRIEDQYGNSLVNFAPKLEEVFSESTYAKMLDMLKGVVAGGTGSRLGRYNIGVTMGGKTGTTQNNSDGWFMGITPKLVAGCWVGGEDRSIHFDRTSDGQGAAMALPIFGLFMKKVYSDSELEYKKADQFPSAVGVGICNKSDDDEPDEHAVGIDNMFN